MIDRIEGFRLAPQQRRLWRLQSGDSAPVFRAQSVVRIAGPLERDRFQAAARRVVERHEILRTRFHELPGTALPVQVIGEALAPEVPWCDLDGLDEASRAARLAELATVERQRPLSLSAAWPLRLVVARVGAEDHVLVVTIPALWGDGIGARNLARELVLAYAGDATAEPLQYADLAEWQNELLEGFAGERLSLPAGVPPPLPLWPRAEGGFAPAAESVLLDEPLAAALEALAPPEQPAAVWLACWLAVLARHGCADATIGVTVGGRGYEGLDHALGVLARDLPLCLRVAEATPFSALVAQAAAALARLEQAQHGFEARDGAGSSLLSFGCADLRGRIAAGALTATEIERWECTERWALRLECQRRDRGATLLLHHDQSRVEPAFARALLRQCATLAAGAAASPGRAVGALEPLDAAERELVLNGFQTRAEPAAPERDVLQRIAERARALPDSAAVISGGVTLSYGELGRRAEQLAQRLRAHGVGPGVLVGLCAERSPELVVGILGIGMAGGAYVPLDPSYPRARLQLVLEDAAVPVVLTRAALRAALPESLPRAEILTLEADAEVAPAAGPAAAPDDLAYVIYTSGSTGRPKGVEITRRNLAASTWARRAVYEHAPGTYLLLSSFAFDSSVAGIFWTLCEGGTLLLPAQGKERDLHEIARLCAEHHVTHLLCLPSLYSLLLRETGAARLGSLRVAIVAGEACPRELAVLHARLLPAAELWNEYGPTEGTGGASAHRCRPGDSGPVPIGRPIPGARIYVLDAARRPLPIGVPGELWVGGAGVARGYRHRQDLTDERFVADPFRPGERVYRTGDLGRWRADGELEFLGRADQQVKIRGWRIELEEVEQALLAAPGVAAAAVAARGAGTDLHLVAYVVPAEGLRLDQDALRRHLAARLPEPMLPAAWSELEELPRLPNGKVDRQALPEPSAPARARPAAAAGPVEEAMAWLWSEVLGIEALAPGDNVFQAGAHSLHVIQMTYRVRDLLEVELPLRAVFDRPTPAGQAELLTADPERRAAVEEAARNVLGGRSAGRSEP